MPGEDRQDHERSDDHDKPLTPYLVLPYYPTDDGSRPLPGTVTYWRCSGILLNGSPYAGQPITTGSAITLNVTVRNLGALATAGVARIYWSNPATAFNVNTVHLIGQVPFYIVKGQTLVSQAITWTTDTTVPAHVCLIAEVTCSGDPALFTFNAADDRHYGQQNLNLISVQPSMKPSFNFLAVNPFREPKAFSIRVAPAGERALRYLASEFHAQPVRLDAEDISLRAVEAGRLARGRSSLNLKLDQHGSHLCQVTFRVPEGLPKDAFVALEVFQTAVGDNSESAPPSLAIVAFGEA